MMQFWCCYLSIDVILKRIIKELIQMFFQGAKVESEVGLEEVRRRVDILIVKPRRVNIPRNSWLALLNILDADHIIIEAKHIGSTIERRIIRQVLEYRILLPIVKKLKFWKAFLILIVSRINDLDTIIRWIEDIIGLDTTIHKISNGLYLIKEPRPFSMAIVAIDELDCEVVGNDALCMLSLDKKVKERAIKRILQSYSKDSFIYNLALVYDIELHGWSILSEYKIELPIRGIITLIEAVGVKNLAKALGPEKAINFAIEIINMLPEDKRKELIKRLIDAV